MLEYIQAGRPTWARCRALKGRDDMTEHVDRFYQYIDDTARRLEAVRSFAKGQAHGGRTYKEQAAYAHVQRMARELLDDLDYRWHSPRDVAMVLAVAQNHPALWHAYATGDTPDIEAEAYLTEYGF